MRRLLIPTFSTLILLCIPFSDPHGCGLHSIGWTSLMNKLLVVGSPAAASARPGTPRAQAPASERVVTPSAQDSVSLEPGKPVERELSGGQSHSYKITMISGQYMEVAVDQRGIDIAVALFTPDGKKIGEADSYKMIEGSETVWAIAEAPGKYLIEVSSREKTVRAGHYRINVEEFRTATVEDKYRVAGYVIFREAEQLKYGTLEAKRKSIEKFHEALELFRKAGDRGSQASTLSNIGEVYWSLGESQKALETTSESLLIYRALGERFGEGEILLSIGVFYLSLGDIRKSLETLNEALPIIREVGNHRAEAVTLSSIGENYRSLGEMQKALENYNEALLLRRAFGDRKGEAITLNNIGLVYSALGEWQKALDKHNEALPIRRAVGDRSGEATTLHNIGAVYRTLGEWRRALDKHNEALPIFRAIGNRTGEATTLTSSGSVYRLLGEWQKALEKFNEALPINRAIGNRSGEAFTLNDIGAVYLSLGETSKALDKHYEALTIFRALGDRNGAATTLHNIGEVYRSLGQTQKAMGMFDESLSLRRAVGDRNREAATLLGVAQAEQKLGNLSQARQTIEQAISVVESLRAGIRMQDLRASYFAARQKYYESYTDILMEQHNQNPAAGFEAAAFAVSERARARSLIELLTESRIDVRQGVDSSLLERERSLQRLLNAKAAAQFALLTRKHTPAQAEAFAKEIAFLTTEYEELRAQIRARSPRYSALTQPQPLSLPEIQQQVLDPDTLLLEYSLGDDASYLFVVSQTSITWRQLPKRAEIEWATRRVRELLTAPQPQPGDTEAKYQARVKEARESYWARAGELSRMLLGPVASQLGRKRLVIVADGALQYIPFAALPSPSSGNDGGRNSGAEPQPLLVEHEIVSLPSASTLATLRRETAGRKPAPKSLAVLADPVFTDDDTRIRRDVGKAGAKGKTRSADSDEMDLGFLQMTRSGRETGVIGGEAGFGRLLGTRREAAAISALVPERERMQALDFEANRTTALRPELSEYRIVHFATHGMLNNIHPELSGIVLSLVDEAGHQQDGFLRLQDIYNLKLPAELVVLSACQSGLGKEIKGEGLIGLTRGFMYAGAPRVVASLWKVDDRVTSELMKRFYQGMLGPEALRPAEALRQAQLSIWKQKQWREPYYWAAFVLQGEWK
jgi:CHAT domain-containing protein